jgi:hypothetical protein
MKCKEIRAISRYGNHTTSASAAEAATHIASCQRCKDQAFLDNLAPALIKASSEAGSLPNDYITSQAFMNSIRARIQVIRQQHSGSLESAIESTKGWIAAFAVTAVILIAVSVQWRPATVSSDIEHDGVELITQTPSEYFPNEIPDLGSNGKDNSHAQQ